MEDVNDVISMANLQFLGWAHSKSMAWAFREGMPSKKHLDCFDDPILDKKMGHPWKRGYDNKHSK